MRSITFRFLRVLFFATFIFSSWAVAAESTRLAVPAFPSRLLISTKRQHAYVASSHPRAGGGNDSYLSVVDLNSWSVVERQLTGIGTRPGIATLVVLDEMLYVGLSYVGKVPPPEQPVILKFGLDELDGGTGPLQVGAEQTVLTQKALTGTTLASMVVGNDHHFYFTLCSYSFNNDNLASPNCYGDPQLVIFDPAAIGKEVKTTTLPYKNPLGLHFLDKERQKLAVLSAPDDGSAHFITLQVGTGAAPQRDPKSDAAFSGFAGQMAFDGSRAYLCGFGDGGKLTAVELSDESAQILPPVVYGDETSSCSDVKWDNDRKLIYVADYGTGNIAVVRRAVADDGTITFKRLSPHQLGKDVHAMLLGSYDGGLLVSGVVGSQTGFLEYIPLASDTAASSPWR